jgi:hypothetical protein
MNHETRDRLYRLESAVSFIANALPKLTLERNVAACVNAHAERMNAIEYRIGTLEAYLDLEPNAPADDEWPCTIHELIADEMTGVTVDCEKRIDAVSERLAIWEQWAAKQEKRIDDTLDYVAERTAGLETARPC